MVFILHSLKEIKAFIKSSPSGFMPGELPKFLQSGISFAKCLVEIIFRKLNEIIAIFAYVARIRVNIPFFDKVQGIFTWAKIFATQPASNIHMIFYIRPLSAKL